LGMIRTPESERNMDVIGAAAGRLNDHMGVLDAHLQKNDWVAGDQLSMGDIPAGALAWRWLNLPIDRPDLPAVTAYHARLAERPAFKTHVMIPLS